ncbi:SagB/ThcOx family dehydrogenase [Geoalkalibacter halelectricus]|uniref:SagB/ThcOx family dehydrogenase n=1 Tax=Geoalkalibacter halelectricus TaxID=2847045 RepID=A0ABY5ZJB9_9BACT|nr:SagB/ThcOx family dehydrogenase [Geoalkalibacter halelectricus]MDO3378192.1 SagB/ThcOx family dehydrogenase [Geoalkalibacter halelectricus]UWZ78035.1 SagB/ThcOx family dehydrogenase [Geoalkalibacter halelectricus]
MSKPSITKDAGRWFLTDYIRPEVDWRRTPQALGEAPPPVQKPVAAGAEVLALPGREDWDIPDCDLATAIARRESRRRFRREALRLDELAFLLWATQGVRERLHEAAVLRTVPSAGCRHPLETYLCILNVAGLAPGIYRYLPLDHALVLEREPDDLAASLTLATHGQRFAGEAAATFVWTALPARTEWRYAEASYKVIALDAGHVCQNLYLACEAIGAGTCAIAAYRQDLMDALLGVDGAEEFTVYLAPVGKV